MRLLPALAMGAFSLWCTGASALVSHGALDTTGVAGSATGAAHGAARNPSPTVPRDDKSQAEARAVGEEALARAAGPAPELSARDCREGSDFIGNAARSRDGGMRADAFVARLEQDLVVVTAMRPAVCWFVYSAREADLLRAGVAAVFARPLDPRAHAREFLARCEAFRAERGQAIRPVSWPLP